MKVSRSIEAFHRVQCAVVTTGTFDGVHVGHRRIIGRMRELAQRIGGETVLLTFDPHPRMVLFPDDHGLQLITTLDEKIGLLREAGIDHLIIHPFTREFSRIHSMDFVRDIIAAKLGTSRLVIGHDHHFGRNREGSFEHLREYGPLYGFEVEEIPAEEVQEVAVSSTKIRKALAVGDIATANAYLGAPFRITGTVVPGDRIGRTIGFPTANLRVTEPAKLIPANGAYAAYAIVDGTAHKAMLNIGERPTVRSRSEQRIEAHILGFDADIYGKQLELRFAARIRDEQRFESLDGLRQQLQADMQTSLALL